MKRTFEISKGNQYDRDGYKITDDFTYGWGQTENNHYGFTMMGNCYVGPEIKNRNEIYKAIQNTLQDGITRIVEAITEKQKIEIPIPESKACPKCGTYCFGDCRN